MMCARPSASVASVLLRCADNAARTWRVSRQTAGLPSAFSSGCSHGDSAPASCPTRRSFSMNGASALAIASGSVSTTRSISTPPFSSTTQIAVSSTATSNPAKHSMPVLRRFAGRGMTPATATTRVGDRLAGGVSGAASSSCPITPAVANGRFPPLSGIFVAFDQLPKCAV